VEVLFDFTPRLWQGRDAYAGKFAFYRGPLLFACDSRFDASTQRGLPVLDAATLSLLVRNGLVPVPPFALGRLRDGFGHGNDGLRLFQCRTGRKFVPLVAPRHEPAAPAGIDGMALEAVP